MGFVRSPYLNLPSYLLPKEQERPKPHNTATRCRCNFHPPWLLPPSSPIKIFTKRSKDTIFTLLPNLVFPIYTLSLDFSTTLATLLRFSAFMAAIPCGLVAPSTVHAKDGRLVGVGVSCCGVRLRNGREGPGWKVLRFGAGSSGRVVLACEVASSYGYMRDAGIGRVGAQRREGSASFLSFGFKKADSSQVLSALLPFVVAATAIAALANPATFAWYCFSLISGRHPNCLC